ncbi:uncharacterized protein PFLUO_LOCUS7038 [Penicillium psychrofluorescens]|uniref:uncharacterized protein n=1 Tax=Penicillium psychrofluorescens TaxID=3158075 RepID=UPI003CCCA2DE
MPRQQTQLRGPKDPSAPKPAQKRKNGRALNALSIAEKQVHTKLGVRRTRLGKSDEPSHKRHSARDPDDEDDERPDHKRRKTEDGESVEGGSDSEGHEWTLGQVESDDDEELDSDEALGESDEERFEAFTFRGSSSNKSKPKKTPAPKKRSAINLDEDDEESENDEDEEEDDDDLGEDAIDLTTAWDMNTAAEEEEAKRAAAKSKKAAAGDDSEEDSGSEEDSEDLSDDDTELSASDDDADASKHGLSKLQDFVNSMEAQRTTKPSRKTNEQANPTEYGLTSTRKLTIADLLPSITDSRLKNSLKHVESVPKQTTSSGIPGKLDAPLPKRQQDRLDRTAAYDKSKETLNRWLETVKANREAEHLMFPLPDPEAEQTHRMDVTKPQTDLENAIQSILVESGLAEAEGKSIEEQVQDFEELQARKLPIEEIQARRAELRKRRDLLFREEVRAKRIKKIKSKSYRRVHRKERERMEQQEQQALLEAGVDMDEEDRDKNERMRAEARMGSKHRESKWAKSLKETGRTAWDENARNSAADLAQREEELRKRIEGKRVSNGDEDYLGSSSSESEDEDLWQEDGGSDAENRKLRQKLSALEENDIDGEVTGPHTNLLSMKFMRNAEAARKEQNDAELRRLNRELHGEESPSEAESEVGRRKFGQSDKTNSKSKAKPLPKNEFEAAPGSDGEADLDQDIDIVVDTPAKQKSQASGAKTAVRPSSKSSGAQKQQESSEEEENPWLIQTERNNRRRNLSDGQETVDISLDDDQKPSDSAVNARSKKDKATKAPPAKQLDADDHDSDDDNVPVLLKNHDLVKRAFAGDEVVQDFEQEKLDTIEDEGDKVVDNTLPGWGSWAGEGISKRQQKRQKRNLTTVEGVKADQRKDAKLQRVIINEKRVKKNTKYMASQLPHPFETKQQYERSLRLPLGPEWSTKEIYQSGTKPRVMVKQGVIKPMEKPM